MSFALWLTGLSGSGKSTVARELLKALHERGVHPAVLESDVMRTQLTPFPRYDDAERERFYGSLVDIAELLVREGTPVVLDATANRRAWRDEARRRLARFAEVYVDTPLEVCMARDPKGLYRAAREGKSSTLPGLQAAYEPPLSPEITVSGAAEAPADAAVRIVAWLQEKRWL